MTPRAKSKLDEEYFCGLFKAMAIVTAASIILVAVGLWLGVIS